MWRLSSEVAETLGPDTSELTMRTGLHSAPVTAGVLRGERSRFQLFGDTMNTGEYVICKYIVSKSMFSYLLTQTRAHHYTYLLCYYY